MSVRTALSLGAALAGLVIAGAANARELKQVGTIAVPGTPLDNFDISFVDQRTNRLYFADRSNASVDIFDVKSGKLLARIPGFTGAQKSNADSGPDGVLVAGGNAWAGDGNSTAKVIDLKTNKIVATVSTGGKKRVDEMAYDPKDDIVIVANNADEPPFATLISNKPGYKVLAKIPLPDASDGIEQPVYYPPNGMFYMSVPELKGQKGKGGVAVIDPRKGRLVKMLPVDGCIPAGLARGPGANLVIGCNAGGEDGLPSVIVVINANTGAVVKSIPGIGAADMVAYNPKAGQYYTASRAMKGGPVLGVIDAKSNTLVQSIKLGGGNPHSVAVSQAGNRVLVPMGTSKGGCGCIAVFAPQ
ncbi:MAG: cytochrome C nitrite reductase [Proteobacteria bacterium]|nr:cytochrome C nitrite reductase [Pseudomonadota bacterium]MBI3496866.1 cytochrome C nitrite reductase [Pseudomonadota bacterium]